MDKKGMLQAMQESRQALLKVMEGLPPEKMQEPGVVGKWSIKDLLAHMSMWEGELIRLIFALMQGSTPESVLVSERSDDEVNAEWYELQKDRPLDRVLADFHAVRKQTLRQLDSFKDPDLHDPKRYPALKGRTLEEIIAGNTYGHEAAHTDQIKAWLARQ